MNCVLDPLAIVEQNKAQRSEGGVLGTRWGVGAGGALPGIECLTSEISPILFLLPEEVTVKTCCVQLRIWVQNLGCIQC